MLTVGWREWLALPDLGVPSIKAKIDTGARTSALHTFGIEQFEKDNQAHVRFLLHPYQNNSEHTIECETPIKDKRIVRDSGGHAEERYVIETALNISNLLFPIELTLTNREDMLFRMLLGRTALKSGNILVSAAESYLSGNKHAPANIDENEFDEELSK